MVNKFSSISLKTKKAKELKDKCLTKAKELEDWLNKQHIFSSNTMISTPKPFPESSGPHEALLGLPGNGLFDTKHRPQPLCLDKVDAVLVVVGGALGRVELELLIHYGCKTILFQP